MRPRQAVPAVLIALTLIACASKANIHTPEGRQAYYQVEALKRIEQLQTVVIDANASGAVSDAVAIPLVRFAVGAAKTIREVPNGWLPVVAKGWAAVRPLIPPDVVTKLGVIIPAVDALLALVGGGA